MGGCYTPRTLYSILLTLLRTLEHLCRCMIDPPRAMSSIKKGGQKKSIALDQMQTSQAKRRVADVVVDMHAVTSRKLRKRLNAGR